MENHLERLESQLHRIEDKASEEARVLRRKVSSEAYRVEGYRKGAEKAQRKAEQARTQGRFLVEAGATLARTLRGLEGRHAAARRTRDELRDTLSAARRENERLTKERAQEHERLEKRLTKFRAEWRELYEGRHGKRPHVQSRESAVTQLREAEERLRDARSALRETQADVFKARCERGRRNAEESGFYPLRDFVTQLARLGAETLSMEQGEARAMHQMECLEEQIRRCSLQPEPRQLPSQPVEATYPTIPSQSGQVMNQTKRPCAEPIRQSSQPGILQPLQSDQTSSRNPAESGGRSLFRQLLQNSQPLAEQGVPNQPMDSHKPTRTLLNTNSRGRFERLKLYTPMFSSPPPASKENVTSTTENRPRMRLYDAYQKRAALDENIRSEKHLLETPRKSSSALESSFQQYVPVNKLSATPQIRVETPPAYHSIEKRPLGESSVQTEAAKNSDVPNSFFSRETSPHFSEGKTVVRGEPKRRYVDVRFENVVEEHSKMTTDQKSSTKDLPMKGRSESPALFGSWDDRPPSRTDLKIPIRKDQETPGDVFNKREQSWKNPDRRTPADGMPYKRPMDARKVETESSFENKRVKFPVGRDDVVMETNAEVLVEKMSVDTVRMNSWNSSGIEKSNVSGSGDGAKNILLEERKDVIRDEAKYVFSSGEKAVILNEPKVMINDGTKDILRDEPKPMFNGGEKDITLDGPKYTFNDGTKGRDDPKAMSNGGSKDINYVEPKYTFSDRAKDILRDKPKTMFDGGSKDLLCDEPKARFLGGAKDTSHVEPKATFSDGTKDILRDAPKSMFSGGEKYVFHVEPEPMSDGGGKDIIHDVGKNEMHQRIENLPTTYEETSRGEKSRIFVDDYERVTENFGGMGMTNEVLENDEISMRISDEGTTKEKAPEKFDLEKEGRRSHYLTPSSQKEDELPTQEAVQVTPPTPFIEQSCTREDTNGKMPLSVTMPHDEEAEKMQLSGPEKDLVGSFDPAHLEMLEGMSVGSSSGQYQTAPCSSLGSNSAKEVSSVPSPFDFERHMKALEAIKASPGFTYSTRKMYEEGGAMEGAGPSFDPTFPEFQQPLSGAKGKPPPKQDFLSFAFDDYLADSPGGSPVRGAEKSLFGGGGDSPSATEVKSPPPLFPMFGGGRKDEDEEKEQSSGFFFSFGGGEEKTQEDTSSGFNFAF